MPYISMPGDLSANNYIITTTTFSPRAAYYDKTQLIYMEMLDYGVKTSFF